MSENYNVTLHGTVNRVITSIHTSGQSSKVIPVSYKKSHAFKSQVSYNSPRNSKGKLLLQQNPYSFEKRKESYTPGGVKRVTDYFWYVTEPDWTHVSIKKVDSPLFVTSIPYPDPASSISRDSAALDFYNKVKSQKINLAMAFAERQQTINMISSTAKRIATSLRLIKKFDVVGAARALGVMAKVKRNRIYYYDRISSSRRALNPDDPRTFYLRKTISFNPKKQKDEVFNRWLELQYGWKPLLSDMRGAMIATVDRPLIRGIVSRVSEEHKFDYYSSDSKVTGSLKNNYTIRGAVIISNPSLSKASELGLTDPFSLAWELLPFSFIVDWFIPVGDFLNAQNALHGVTLVDTSSTFTKTWNIDIDKKPIYYNNDSTSYSVTSAKARGYRKLKNRTLGLPPLPVFPPLSPNLSVTKAISSVALINQRFFR